MTLQEMMKKLLKHENHIVVVMMDNNLKLQEHINYIWS